MIEISPNSVGYESRGYGYVRKDFGTASAAEGDLVAILSAGAYGFVMAGTYNTRPLPAEVLVKGKKSALVRKRQKVKEIWGSENTAAWQK